MVGFQMSEPEYVRVMADGTVKQINPFTGTHVWTVPGRGNRPLAVAVPEPRPLADPHTATCAFCPDRYLETPPEKSRVINRDGQWTQLNHVLAEDINATQAEFRRIPNLFEIVSYDYWRENYYYSMPDESRERMEEYMGTPAGRAHVMEIAKTKLKASRLSEEQIAQLSDEELTFFAQNFFAGGHDLIVARRHYTDDATDTSCLASAGTLTPEEHREYIRLAVDGMRDLYAKNRYARYVSVFQNWLKPAGASFDHLHKQLLAIDELGPNNEAATIRARQVHNIFNQAGPNYAIRHDLILAENDHAIAYAGFGHRYPSLEVFSKSPSCFPWEQTMEEVDAMSDLIHAMHAVTGAGVPCNEEWHTQPIDIEAPMPWRVVLKWRVSNLAGFEGGTKIYINTLSPMDIKSRVLPELQRLREAGKVAPMLIGDECHMVPNPLRYLGR